MLRAWNVRQERRDDHDCSPGNGHDPSARDLSPGCVVSGGLATELYRHSDRVTFYGPCRDCRGSPSSRLGHSRHLFGLPIVLVGGGGRGLYRALPDLVHDTGAVWKRRQQTESFRMLAVHILRQDSATACAGARADRPDGLFHGGRHRGDSDVSCDGYLQDLVSASLSAEPYL